MSNWASGLVAALGAAGKMDRDKSGLLFATVVKPNPLEIEIAGQKITKHIHAPSTFKQVNAEFMDNPLNNQWFKFIKAFAEQNSLNAGDLLIVFRAGDEFYVLTKVV